MSELRWTLLILGVVFIAALTWWERRRPRQAFAPRLREGPEGARPGTGRVTGEPANGTARPHEPWIGDTALSDVVSADVALANAPAAREELPTLVIPDGFPASLPSSSTRVSEEALWLEPPPPEPRLIDPESTVELLDPVRPDEPVSAQNSAPAAEPEPEPEPEPECQSAPEPQARSPTARESELEIVGAEGVGRVRVILPSPAEVSAPVEPIVEWPPEESRRILALRVAAPPAERFPGRTLRLALAAEGFLLGKFSIFHKPDEMNRAVLSAASLTRPGAFDLETMDSQRYGGLALFVVLPGSKTPPQAFEELLAAARNLNDRLQGALQDERGSPLTALRLASLRESLRAEAATPLAARANEA